MTTDAGPRSTLATFPQGKLIPGRRVLLLCLVLAGGGPARAEPSPDWTLRGVVLDGVTGEPIEAARVAVGDARTVTTPAGAFELVASSTPATLRVEAPGYLGTEVTAEAPGEPEGLTIRLFPRRDFIESIQVRDTLPPPEEPSAFSVTPADVLSSAGSVDNVFRTLSTLPGVTAIEDFGSRLSVRGGSPDQNLTILDGVEVHNPFRLAGITSAFNPETIDNFELTAGGFGAEYGDRLSSILRIENRTGSRDFGGSASLSITDANVVLEGPMPGDAEGSWLVTGRRTYYDLLAGFNTDDELPAFADLQGQASWVLGPGHRITLAALGSREDSDFDDRRSNGESLALVSNARNDLVSASLELDLGREWLSDTTVAFYRNRDIADFQGELRQQAKRSNSADGDIASLLDEFVFTREFGLRDWSLRQDTTWKPSPRHEVKLGGELHALSTTVLWKSLGEDRNLQEANGSSVRGGAGLPDELDSELDSTRGGLWVADRWRPGGGVSLEPGLRFDWSTNNRRSTISPRFAAGFDLGAGASLRAALGLYTQSPGYEKLIQSDYFIDLSDAVELRLAHERATHFVVGFEKRLGSTLTARVEGYYKRFSDLIVGRLETEDERLARIARYDFPPELQGSVPTAPIITSTPTNDSGGRAYGLDFFLAQRDPSARLSGWVSYTLGRAERRAYARLYPLEYDRRHAFNLVGRYRFGERFDLAWTARLASGFPYTPATGVRVAAREDDRGRLVPQTDSRGNLVYAADFGSTDNLNAGRLPVYARVDLRATFRPGGRTGRWSIYVEALNLLNRDNAVRFETWLTHDPSSTVPDIAEVPSEGFPLLPSVGVRFRF